jgi:hypothetical protein
MQSAIGKKSFIKRILKWVFGGFTVFFVAMLTIITVHDIMTGESSNTAEYYTKYGIFASTACW